MLRAWRSSMRGFERLYRLAASRQPPYRPFSLEVVPMRRAKTVGLIVILWSVFFIAAGVTNDLCGSVVVDDLTLDHDLACAGSGLIAGADGISLNLNGHVISGAGSGDGIAIVGRTDVTVKGGRIQNFTAGVRVTLSSDVQIKNTTIADNTDGIDCAAECTGSTFKANEFRNNRARGIMLRGLTRDNVVKDNVLDGNRVGVLLFGAVDTVVKDNILSSSVVANIRVNVLATGNTIRDNTASTSPAGVEFLITPTGSATGNAVVENTLIANLCGLKGPLGGNIVRHNVFVAPGTEICP